MKKRTGIAYIILLAGLGLMLALGIFLLVMGLKMGPEPLTMPWTHSV